MRFPLSCSQQRVWLLDQLEPGHPTYNMPYQMWLDGPLDEPALQRSLDALVARHAVLRTSIVVLGRLPEQVVADTGTVPVERIELPPGLEPAERTRRAEAIAAERARQPFELAAGPLLRASLVTTGPDRHLFVLVVHHIVGDGLTVQLLISELSACYRAEVTGRRAALPPLPMSYGDYAAWQQDRLRGEELERQLSYWRGQLRGAPQFLALPTDRPRPARRSPRGALASATIDAATTRRLTAVAHRANATPFMVFLAGFTAVLARYARQADVVIITQMAGRTHAELEPIAGMFNNTIPLRMSLAGDPTFAELLSRVRDTTVGALLHQETPFEKLIDEFAAGRRRARTPLIQVQFVFESFSAPVPDFPGIIATAGVVPTGTSKVDLTLDTEAQQDGGTMLVLEYSTELFGQAWADRFLRCTANLLEHAASAPGTAVADLRLMHAGERQELIAGRSGHALAADDGDADARRLVQASPSRVVDTSGELPVSAVCDRASRVARRLADHGAGQETLVGLCTGRGTGMLTGLLGVWWAGGAYVPLDPDLPAARLAAMAGLAGLRVIITDAAHRELARSVAGSAELICLDDPAVTASFPLDPVPLPETALAYVIFTSGSTGQPKGVAVEHRAVANLLTSLRRALRLRAAGRFLALGEVPAEAVVPELLLPLACGADLVIAAAGQASEPSSLRALIRQTGATAMQATARTWRLLESAGGVPDTLGLRLCGSEPLTPGLVAALMSPESTAWTLYGLAETTAWSAAAVVTGTAGAAAIGPPIERTRCYLLDEHLMPVPVGAAAEVWVAGRAVARGYHGRARLTAASFRPDPWSTEPGARMYRTGDLGRWLEGEGLELLGRSDHQVKIRGFRIECGEIEALLRRHRDVRQAAVVAADRAGERALVGYLVPRRGSALAQPDADLLAELRPQLRAELPDYMIPALILALPALPLTPNAKVDRAALPAPPWADSAAAAGVVQPRNPVEATLAGIWADLLGSEAPLSVHDNLFALGGHSLTATRFVARVADAYGVSLPVHHVFAGPTIAELAEAIAADPGFGGTASSSRQAQLEGLSDDELDDLLRAAMAQRSRRQATAGGSGA
ncbi:MAG TPA: amino acid adenylation domain-containing protein [Streptosporangiaceae bacterium]